MAHGSSPIVRQALPVPVRLGGHLDILVLLRDAEGIEPFAAAALLEKRPLGGAQFPRAPTVPPRNSPVSVSSTARGFSARGEIVDKAQPRGADFLHPQVGERNPPAAASGPAPASRSSGTPPP